MEMICRIEVIKDGQEFVVRVHLASGSIKEFRHQSVEDEVTEKVINLQEQIVPCIGVGEPRALHL